MEITYRYNHRGYYEVFVNGKHYCNCDVGEVRDVENEIREEISDG